MDSVNKMRSSLKGGLKRDTLIPTVEQPIDQRKRPEEKVTNLYPIRLQIPINKQQNSTLNDVAGLRRVANINKGSVLRALINLLKQVEFTEDDQVTTEKELENLLRQKLKAI